MTKGVSIGKDAAVSGARRDGAAPRKVSVWSGSARRETKRSWRRGVFVAGWREGRLRLFVRGGKCSPV